MWPAGRIALLSLIETPMTFESPPWDFNSSPTVLTSRRRGDEPARPGTELTSFDFGSKTLVTFCAVSRSYHSLAMIPLTDGGAPLRNVECPTAVTVVAWR